MTPDERIDRFMAGCLDCGASLANRNRNTRRCTPCSTARRIMLGKRSRPVTVQQVVKYLAANAPKTYQSIIAKIREAI